MIRRATALVPAVGAARRFARLSVASLLVTTGIAMATAGSAGAAEVGFLTPDSDIGFADSDGIVPI